MDGLTLICTLGFQPVCPFCAPPGSPLSSPRPVQLMIHQAFQSLVQGPLTIECSSPPRPTLFGDLNEGACCPASSVKTLSSFHRRESLRRSGHRAGVFFFRREKKECLLSSGISMQASQTNMQKFCAYAAQEMHTQGYFCHRFSAFPPGLDSRSLKNLSCMCVCVRGCACVLLLNKCVVSVSEKRRQHFIVPIDVSLSHSFFHALVSGRLRASLRYLIARQRRGRLRSEHGIFLQTKQTSIHPLVVFMSHHLLS